MNTTITKSGLPISRLEQESNKLHDSDYILLSELSSDRFYSKKAKVELFKNFLKTDISGTVSASIQELSNSIISDNIDPVVNKMQILSDQVDYTISTLTDITQKTPVQVWEDGNEYADKNWVNSSIATNTSYFRGTYTALSDLEDVSAYNNDYAFLCSLISAGTEFEYVEFARYKFLSNDISSQGWTFEYTLNNSSYTQNQWTAINSGITSALVEKLENITQEEWTFVFKDPSKAPITKNIAILNTTTVEQ